MIHVLAERLLLRAGATEVSQPVAMEKQNGANIQVWLIHATAALASSGVTVSLEGSDDLENWDISITAGDANLDPPMTTWIPGWGGFEDVPYPYVRLKYVSASSQDILMGASISTHTMP